MRIRIALSHASQRPCRSHHNSLAIRITTDCHNHPVILSAVWPAFRPNGVERPAVALRNQQHQLQTHHKSVPSPKLTEQLPRHSRNNHPVILSAVWPAFRPNGVERPAVALRNQQHELQTHHPSSPSRLQRIRRNRAMSVCWPQRIAPHYRRILFPPRQVGLQSPSPTCPCTKSRAWLQLQTHDNWEARHYAIQPGLCSRAPDRKPVSSRRDSHAGRPQIPYKFHPD